MEDDLRMAREVQVAMLPREFPVCHAGSGATLGFAHLYEPAGGVGGDFYDVLPVSATAAGIIICDVMGHGVRSALITAMVRTMIEELRPHAADPAAMLTRLNVLLTRLLQRRGRRGSSALAAYCGQSMPRTGEVAPRRRPATQRRCSWSARRGTAVPLPGAGEIGGSALGLLDDSTDEAMTLSLEAGDRSPLFTDGIDEADDGAGEEFGITRLAESLQASSAVRRSQWSLAGLKAAASIFSGGRPFGDDVCRWRSSCGAANAGCRTGLRMA